MDRVHSIILAVQPLFHLSCICSDMQLEKEEACRLLKRHPETEKTRIDATADMSEDLFEGEKGEDAGDPSVAYGDSTTGISPKTSSVDKLYIVLIRYGDYCFSITTRSR